MLIGQESSEGVARAARGLFGLAKRATEDAAEELQDEEPQKKVGGWFNRAKRATDDAAEEVEEAAPRQVLCSRLCELICSTCQ